MKDIICDSSSLISLTDSALEEILYFFAHRYQVRFLISAAVEYESVNRPIESKIKPYLFSAIRLKKAINDNILVKVERNGSVKQRTLELLKSANNLFFVKGKPLHLVQYGEAEALALARELDVNHILIDERTTRMLVEAPFRIKEHLEQEFGSTVMVNRENMLKLSELTKGLEFMRSSELVLLSYESGYMEDFHDLKKQALEAALYKIKFSGCAISMDELAEIFKEER